MTLRNLLLLYFILLTGVSCLAAATNEEAEEGINEFIDTTNCPKEFLGKCHCKNQNYPHKNSPQQFVVNCSHTHFTDVSILEELPVETNVLIFTGNLLDKLPDNLFGFDIDAGQLKHIDLSNNHITFIKGQTFHRVREVETLILNMNKLEISDEFERLRIFSNFKNLKNLHLTDAFTDRYNASAYYIHNLENIFNGSGLDNLQQIYLEQNEIVSIGENASIFCHLKSLEKLHLSDNKLSDMEFRVNCLEKLTFIDMRYNMITRLSDHAMKRLDDFVGAGQPLSLNLRNNPLSCDCRAKNFVDWVSSSGVQLDEVENYLCLDGFPHENIGKSINDVKFLDCEDSSKLYSSGTVGFLSFLIVFMVIVVIVLGLYHKQRLSKLIQPLVDDVTRKMGYKGLANQDHPQEVQV